MNKFVIIIGSILGIGILITGIYFAFFAPQPTSSGTFLVPSNSGKQIQVNDFTKNLQAKTEASDVIAETNQYTISYFTADKSFLITLESQPLKDSRAAAEQALLSKLGITQAQACQLKTSVKTTFDVDQVWAGNELGLSFCPNSIQF